MGAGNTFSLLFCVLPDIWRSPERLWQYGFRLPESVYRFGHSGIFYRGTMRYQAGGSCLFPESGADGIFLFAGGPGLRFLGGF